jgi:hypothetical protein
LGGQFEWSDFLPMTQEVTSQNSLCSIRSLSQELVLAR